MKKLTPEQVKVRDFLKKKYRICFERSSNNYNHYLYRFHYFDCIEFIHIELTDLEINITCSNKKVNRNKYFSMRFVETDYMDMIDKFLHINLPLSLKRNITLDKLL